MEDYKNAICHEKVRYYTIQSGIHITGTEEQKIALIGSDHKSVRYFDGNFNFNKDLEI